MKPAQFVVILLLGSYCQILCDVQALAQRIGGPAALPGADAQPAETRTETEPGYLGVITDDRSEAGRGTRIVQITPDSPAALAGLKLTDLITAIDGRPIRSIDDIVAVLKSSTVGSRLKLSIVRADKPQTIEVTLGRRPPPEAQTAPLGLIPEPSDPLEKSGGGELLDSLVLRGANPELATRGQRLGVRTSSVTDELRRRLRLPTNSGAVVISHAVGSAAQTAGIPIDAVIIKANGQPVSGPHDLARILENSKDGQSLKIRYLFDGREKEATVTLAGAPPENGASDKPKRVVPPPPRPDMQPVGQPVLIPANKQPLPADDTRPIPGDTPAPAMDQALQIEQLDRRILALELRLRRLEKALQRAGEPDATTVPDEQRDTPTK